MSYEIESWNWQKEEMMRLSHLLYGKKSELWDKKVIVVTSQNKEIKSWKDGIKGHIIR